MDDPRLLDEPATDADRAVALGLSEDEGAALLATRARCRADVNLQRGWYQPLVLRYHRWLAAHGYQDADRDS